MRLNIILTLVSKMRNRLHNAAGDETDLNVVRESQGQGVGTQLIQLYRANNPTAPSGGLSAAGEAANRKAFQNELDLYEEDRLNGLLDPADEITDGFFNLTDAEDYAASALPVITWRRNYT